MTGLERRPSSDYDVVVIGGGITGAGVIRELALRGFKVACFEKSDFASGTSSQSSKLIHGGLRYLEHAQFRLVYEALAERHHWCKVAPHLVQPHPFVIPIYKQDKRPMWMIRIGLFLYRCLAGRRGVGKHEFWSRDKAIKQVPHLNPEGLKGAAVYYDAGMNDSRLCIESILQAEEWGAEVFNYMAVTQAERKDGYVLKLEDQLTGETMTVTTKLVVNATGPWTDQLLGQLFNLPGERLAPSQGIHLVTKKWTDAAVLIQSKPDNRVFFVIPKSGYTLIGTTETPPAENPDLAQVNRAEVEYLLDQTNRVFPSLGLTHQDVWGAFVGTRPLLRSTRDAGKRSREHRVIWHNPHLVSLLGGKYTTFRVMAEDLCREILSRLRSSERFRPLTQDRGVFGGKLDHSDAYIAQQYETEAQPLGLSKSQYAGLIQRYADRYRFLLSLIQDDPDLAASLPGSPYLRAEVIYAIRVEHAKTLFDFVRRRSELYFLPDNGRQALDSLGKLYAAEFGWSNHEKEMAKSDCLAAITAGCDKLER